jgi:hypothetical protein
MVPTTICGCVGLVLVFFASIFGSLKSSDVCREAVEKARNSDAVKAELGEPIDEGFLVTGNVRVNTTGTGNANLTIPISGPKGSATIFAVAQRRGGVWNFNRLEVVSSRHGNVINLLAK